MLAYFRAGEAGLPAVPPRHARLASAHRYGVFWAASGGLLGLGFQGGWHVGLDYLAVAIVG
jgi:hypothetical protein